jgi:hypothetical protein
VVGGDNIKSNLNTTKYDYLKGIILQSNMKYDRLQSEYN